MNKPFESALYSLNQKISMLEQKVASTKLGGGFADHGSDGSGESSDSSDSESGTENSWANEAVGVGLTEEQERSMVEEEKKYKIKKLSADDQNILNEKFKNAYGFEYQPLSKFYKGHCIMPAIHLFLEDASSKRIVNYLVREYASE
jgi:hypothetical protein